MTRLRFLITAGPTQEYFDPVRFFTNRSSGKMGYALADAARRMGHDVLLVSGPTQLKAPKGVRFIPVISAQQMHRQVMAHYARADVILKVAAVADYRPTHKAKHKIKKSHPVLNLTLIKNPDILKELGRKKRPHQVLVGFAAESQKPIQYAKKKLKEKNCDWIVLNHIGKKGVGFGSDENEVTLISKMGEVIRPPRDSKGKIARLILKAILKNTIRS